MKKLLFACFVLAAPVVSAQVTEFNTPESWSQPKAFTVAEEDGKKILIRKGELWATAAGEMVEIKPNRIYELSAEFKTDADKSGIAELGFYLYDKDKKVISYQHVGGQLFTDTVLLEPCKKGDKTIQVQNAGRWHKGGGRVAFDVPPHLDEPFFNVVGIVKITHSKQGSTIELRKGVGKDYPAGTRVRQHTLGHHFYCWRGRITKEWKNYSGRVQRISKNGVEKGKFWPSAKYFKVRFAVNLGSPGATTFIRNFKLKIIRESYF